MNKANVLLMWLLVLFAGCQNENSPKKTGKLTSLDMKIYEEELNARKMINRSLVSVVSPEITRSTPDQDENIYQVLFSCDKNELDSLYSVYCSSETEQMYDSLSNIAWSKLEEITSEESCDYLFECIEDYINNNGHNIELLAEMVKDQPEIIKVIILRTAADIDVTLDTINPLLLNTRARSEPCLMELLTGAALGEMESKMLEELLEMAVLDPEFDAIAALGLAGYDLYSAIELVRKYRECRAGIN